MERTHSLTSFSDDELLRRLSDLLGQSRRDEADLVAHIGEVDRRRLYAREASPSMFAYCTEVLHLSEAEAYLRIAAARASREHPLLLTMLADGRLHLTAIAKLAPHLTPENREALLKRAAHRSKREIEELVAELAPRPDAPAVMRKLPDRRAGTMSPALRLGPDAEVLLSDCVRREVLRSIANSVRTELPRASPNCVRTECAAAGVERRPPGAAALPASPRARPAVVEPLAPARYKVQFTASAELHDKLERLRALMRPSVPDGDLGRDRRASRHREAPEARSSALRPDPGAEEDALAERDLPHDAPDPGRGEASRVRAGRRPMPLRGRTGKTMHGAPGARVPPPAPVRPRR